MKKLLWISVFGLFLNINVNAEIITFYNCASEKDNYVFNNKKHERYEIRFNLSKRTIENIIIFTDDFVKRKGESQIKNIINEEKIDNVIDHFAIRELKKPDGSIILRWVYDLKLKRFEVMDYSAEQNWLMKCK